MKARFCLLLAGLGVFLAFAPGAVQSQDPSQCIDKARCAQMLRFGNEAYARGKYLDAKEYFRKAVQADPTSQTAWRYYDQATLFALAEKVEQNAGLTLPGVSQRQEAAGPATETAAPPPPPQPAAPPASQPGGFKIMHDEGC